jgi:Ulp1 protease family, C-terminal catalytic domain
MGTRDLYQAIRRARKFDNAQLILVPLIEKKVKNDSGHWLLFAIDLRNDTIYLFDPCNEFMGSYGACDEIKRVFLGPYLSYKA